jgi:alpha-methylacyl-CoA racemase
MTGPLKGVKVLEFASIGPGPFCAMLLSDMGAQVTRIDRPGGTGVPGLFDDQREDVTNRGRRSLALDLKNPEAVKIALKLAENADALVEGYRPGVMEKLGLGPDVCLKRNPRLIYGRMTGWGQSGPLKDAPGHDLNYVALSGALHALAAKNEAPRPPLNLVGDQGGGGLMLAFGITCALLEAARSGKGQVVDAAMTDGAALLMTGFYGFHAQGKWNRPPGDNILDGAAPFYGCYVCADGKYISVGPLEPKFYAELLEKIGLQADPKAQYDRAAWPSLRTVLTAKFKEQPRDAWCFLLEGTNACVAPVLDLAEAPQHPHNADRGTFTVVDGRMQPAPAPRLSRTPAAIQGPAPVAGADSRAILAELGLAEAEVEALLKCAAVVQA